MPRSDILPVQILAKGRNENFELNKDALKGVLQCSWKQPTAIISICGDKRKGKSFLINYFINYLTENLEDKVLGLVMPKILEPIFEWRGGPARNTEGIWITSKPINIGPIALYIMDTQGMFDNKTTKHECTQIFTLSTLMSSFLVFNLLRQLQSNDIEHLSFWTKSAHWVGNESSSPVLQNLLLLIRDFPHKELGYGEEGGSKYLESEIGESVGNDEVATNLDNLRKIFNTVSAFALPSPGKAIEKRDDSVEAIKKKNIDKKFRGHAHELFGHLKEHVMPLKLNGVDMDGETLYGYVLKCADCILSGKMPMPKELSDLVADHWLHDLVRKITLEYQGEMKKVLETFRGEYDQLQAIHKTEKASAMARFDQTNKFGREQVIEDSRKRLEEELENQFQILSRFVKEVADYQKREAALKKQMHELEKSLQLLAEQHTKDSLKAEALESRMVEIAETLKEKDAKDAKLAQLTSEMQQLQNSKQSGGTEIREKSSWWIPFFYSSDYERVTKH